MSARISIGGRPGCEFFTFGGIGLQPSAARPHGIGRLPTDPLGSFTLVLKNVVVGSRYRIERTDTGALATPTVNAEGTVPGVSGVTDVSITLDYYAVGNAGNDLRAKVRKGTSSPKYQPFETLFTAAAGTVNAYVAQVADTIA